MAKKYLSLEEAAGQLGLPTDELIRLRERNEIRGYADRGTWKFKLEDVEEFGRRRQTDSDPDVPLLDDDEESSSILGGDDIPRGSSILGSSILAGDDDLGELPTEIRGSVLDEESGVLGGTSDSDVRLILDASLSSEFGSDPDVDALPVDDTDSDVRLVNEAQSQGAGSDSDVQLIRPESDSDVRLAPVADEGSDSDVQLIGQGAADASDSDVTLAPEDSGLALSLNDDDADASVLSDEEIGSARDGSGLTFTAESGIALEKLAESGISLEGDSGIALAGLDDSGIALHADSGLALAEDSGIGLSDPAESGIALESIDDDDMKQTFSLLDSSAGEDDDPTALEMPAMADDDSEFDLSMSDDDVGAETSVILFDDDDDVDEDHATMVRKSADEFDGEDEVFDLGDDTGGEFEDDLDVADDVLGEDDELDDMDVFDAGDEDFDDSFEAGESHAEFVAPLGTRMEAPAETEWGAGTFAGLACATGLLAVCGMVMFDLLRSMWSWSEPTAFNTALLDILRGLF